MASFPPQRPAAQRRASPPEEASSAQQEQAARTNSFSAQSVDSQTLLLNSPPHESATPAVEPHKEAPHASHTAPSEDDEPRKCWICFTDETEDDETTSEWRAPCVCSLVAHEKCLLDWIADMEAPSSRRTVGPRASRIQCPQCKSEIRITRPGSFVVDAVRLGERLISTLLLPGVAIVTGTALYSTLALAGTHTVYQLFGPQDALHILAPLYEKPDLGIASPVLRLFSHLQQHWRLHLGLPLIPTVLIASRTTLADSFLPFLPLIFFAGSGQPGDELIQLQWPPSAAFSFAALPYLRGFYNAFYDRICLPKERQWLEEIQPRAGTEDAADAEAEVEHGHDHHDHHHHDHHHNDHHHHDHHHHDHHHDHDHEEIEEVEIQVDFDIFGYWNGEGIGIQDPQHAPVPPGPAQPLNAPPLLHAEAQGAAPAPNVPLQPPQPHVRRVHHEANIALSASSIADAILGALILPSIAAAMGELLHHTLPTSWVTLPSSTPSMSWLGGWIATGGKVGGKSRPTGFLQTRWGRSLVGGCLFVGLKDAVLLYVRWKMAQNHRRRRILDCDPKDRKIGKTS